MATQRTIEISVSLSEALAGGNHLFDNPLIKAIQKFEPTAQLIDLGYQVYTIRVCTPIRRFIHLPGYVREWLHNYLHNDIVRPITFEYTVPMTVPEQFRLAKAYKKLKNFPQPRANKKKKKKKSWNFTKKSLDNKE